ncbi:hypothetical protein C3B51_05790 [Pseudoalteromonas rubra]|uniref:Uncharacterized protein n=1 Tax=Pseudoalteromonas rubra TaxID=43658 RepID=A0A4Q7EJ48_9GAMM|nr:hypothetical protein [Pseudoalteromonas rubra]RZM83788.1 hypothetical protein C3B51_05790 [Pseudoalteromonas rubra]
MTTETKPISQQLTEVAGRANALCQTVADKAGEITTTLNAKLAQVDARVTNAEASLNTEMVQAQSEFNSWKSGHTELVNGLDVHKQGKIKRYFFATTLGNGGYTADRDGPDAAFPHCASPQEPYYINLLEFDAQNGGGFGAAGDYFKCEVIMTHRGMFATSYTEHLVFTGTSFQDCVSAVMEAKSIVHNNHLSLFISEPDNPAKEIPLGSDLAGSSVPVNFRAIGQGYDSGIARLTLKVDPRFHCGASRAISVSTEYTSERGRPSAERISQNQPTWEQ